MKGLICIAMQLQSSIHFWSNRVKKLIRKTPYLLSHKWNCKGRAENDSLADEDYILSIINKNYLNTYFFSNKSEFLNLR